MTVYDVLKMTQGAMAANNLTYTSAIDFIKIINLVIGNKAIPESEYVFKKVCTYGINFKRFYFCLNCRSKIEILNNSIAQSVCSNCNSNNKKDFFVNIPVKDYLTKIISSNLQKIELWRNEVSQKKVSDIHNSNWYQTVKDCNNGKFFTINVNTDGVAIFNSSRKKSLWPILVTINDLPINTRFDKKNVLVAGYWMSEIEVEIDLFFEPFLEELNDLYINGIDINNDNYKVVVACCCLDSVARAKFLKIKQFNGLYGCTICLQKSSNSRYPYKEQISLRTYDHYKECIRNLDELQLNERNKEDSIMGVKGLTVMASCPRFDPIVQVPVDSMHNVFLGVTKLLIKIWFDPKYNDKAFYIPPNSRIIIDKRLKNLQTFSECGRLPRNITEYKKWKANEMYNWLFYYSRYCLIDGILSGPYYRHLLLLADCMEKLHSSFITNDQLIQVEANLKLFVRDFERFYGKECMVYNVHLLLHLTKAVRDFGPLTNYSLFVYENFNGVLGNFLRGPSGPLIQLAVRHFSYFKIAYNDISGMSLDAFNFCRQIIRKKSTFYKNSNDRRKFETIVIQTKRFKSYRKYYKLNKTLCIFNENNKTKYNDSYIYLNEQFIRIKKILIDDKNNMFILGSTIVTQQFSNLPNYFQVQSVQEPVIHKIDKDFYKCFLYEIDDETAVLSIIRNSLIVD